MKRAFVIAMPCEADCLKTLVRADEVFVAGIGKVNAALTTQKAIDAGATEIWNVGLCGGFGADIRVGDIYGVERASEYDFDLAKINHTSVGTVDGFSSPYFACRVDKRFETFDSFRGWKTLATGDHFNDGESDYELITRQLGASLRDMEGAAIAHVCTLANVPFTSLKCVTNVAGQGLMTGQYEENKARCLRHLASFLRELFSRIW